MRARLNLSGSRSLMQRAWEKPKYLGTLSMLRTYTLEPVGIGTKITCEVESEKYGIFGILGKFLEKLYLRKWAERKCRKSWRT